VAYIEGKLAGYSGATAPDLHRTSLFGPGLCAGITHTLMLFDDTEIPPPSPHSSSCWGGSNPCVSPIDSEVELLVKSVLDFCLRKL